MDVYDPTAESEYCEREHGVVRFCIAPYQDDADGVDLNLVSSPTVAAAYTAHWRQRLAVSVRFDRREDWCRVSSAEAR